MTKGTRVFFPLILLLLLPPSFLRGREIETTTCNETRLMEDYFDWKLETHPTWANKLGIHKYDRFMEDISNRGLAAKVKSVKEWKRKIQDCASKNHLTDLMKEELDIFLDGYKFRHFYFAPVNFMEAIHTKLARIYSKPGFLLWNTVQDYRNNLEKLRGIPDFFRDLIDLLTTGSEVGITYAFPSIDRTMPELEELVSTPAVNSTFYRFFKNVSSQEEFETVSLQALEVIRDRVIPSLATLKTYLTSEYAYRAKPGISNNEFRFINLALGMSSLPDGLNRYNATLRSHTTLSDVSPERVHQMGLEEVARLSAEFRDVIKTSFNSSDSVTEFFARVKEDPQYEFESEEEALQFYSDMLTRTINPRLEQDLLTPEVSNVKIVEVPPNGPGGYVFYRSPAADGSRPGTVYLNMKNLKDVKRYDAAVLCLHEANPGHHFQETFLGQRNFPAFIKNAFYDGTLAQAPSRLPVFTAYLEGWALYSEYLGHEMNIYEDYPLQLIGYYSFNLLRAARLVVDTGIHAMNWSVEEARTYLSQHTAMGRKAIEGEVDRYITWPGQATSYKVGELYIQRLRKEFVREKSELKKFHSDLLSCPGSIEKIRDCISKRRIVTEKLQKKDEPSRSSSSSSSDTPIRAIIGLFGAFLRRSIDN